MCIALPGKIKEVDGNTVTVDYDGVEKKAVNTNLKLHKGDYVLVQAGFVTQKLDEKEAQKTIKNLKERLAR